MAETVALLHADEMAFTSEGPQPLLREIPPGQPYPVEALGPLQAAAQAVEGETLAPVALAAQSALGVASLAVQGFADVETMARGAAAPLSLFILTVAVSGERKSGCDRLLLRGLQDYVRDQDARHADDMQSWRNAHAVWKKQHSTIIEAVGKAGAKAKSRTEAEADLAALGREPAAPPSPSRTFETPTVAGMSRAFREGMPTQGLFSTEGGQFLGGHAMNQENRQATLATLNKLWDGGGIHRTLGGEGNYNLYGRRMAAHLMVQPRVAAGLLADPVAGDTGALARFLVSDPESTMGTRLSFRVRNGEAELDAHNARLRAICETPLPINPDTGALEPRLLRLSAEARALLTKYADAIEVELGKGGRLSGITGAGSKIAEQACRIAGVLTMWRDLQAVEVGADDMACGIEIAEYYLSEALRLTDAASVSEETDRAERLRRWLVETWQDAEVTTSEVVRHGPVRALRETKVATSTLSVLEKHGWVVALPAGTIVRGAARSTAWRIIRGAAHAV